MQSRALCAGVQKEREGDQGQACIWQLQICKTD